MCRVENTDLMLKWDHGNKIYVYISQAINKRRKNFRQILQN